jgi:hypothetical protein
LSDEATHFVFEANLGLIFGYVCFGIGGSLLRYLEYSLSAGTPYTPFEEMESQICSFLFAI